MKILQSHSLLWIAVASCTVFLKAAAEEDSDYEDDMSRSVFNRSRNVRACRYRRQSGVCKRRSDCQKPTTRVCQFGINPVICCLDDGTTTTTTTRAPPRPRPRPQPDLQDSQNSELTFPGCGLRSPNVIGNDHRGGGGGGGGGRPTRRESLLSRLGKRDVNSYYPYKRTRRFVSPVIVGGVEASMNSWPWMAALFKQNIPTNEKTRLFVCGASLISKNYVITAAHCFDGDKELDASKYRVILGSHTSKDGTEYRVQQILIHPNYRKKRYYNDICILKLKQPVTMTKKIYPVCLPSDGLAKKILPSNNNVTVTGWGDTSFGGVGSKVLHELTIPVVPMKQCNESYSRVTGGTMPQGITNNMICAGVSEGGKDSCQGDSGGPLVMKLKDNSYVQLGVVSFGYQCARAGYPGVYTRVSKYMNWLYEKTDIGRKS